MMKYSVAVIAALALTGCKDSAEESTKKSFDKYEAQYTKSKFAGKEGEATETDAAKVTKVDDALFTDMDKKFKDTQKWLDTMNTNYVCTTGEGEDAVPKTFPINCYAKDDEEKKILDTKNKDIKEGQELLDSAKKMDAARTDAFKSVISDASKVSAVPEIEPTFTMWALNKYFKDVKDIKDLSEEQAKKFAEIVKNIKNFDAYIQFARAHGKTEEKKDSGKKKSGAEEEE